LPGAGSRWTSSSVTFPADGTKRPAVTSWAAVLRHSIGRRGGWSTPFWPRPHDSPPLNRHPGPLAAAPGSRGVTKPGPSFPPAAGTASGRSGVPSSSRRMGRIPPSPGSGASQVQPTRLVSLR